MAILLLEIIRRRELDEEKQPLNLRMLLNGEDRRAFTFCDHMPDFQKEGHPGASLRGRRKGFTIHYSNTTINMLSSHRKWMGGIGINGRER
jgi:hypothetical protein